MIIWHLFVRKIVYEHFLGRYGVAIIENTYVKLDWPVKKLNVVFWLLIDYTCILNLIFRFKSSEWALWIFIEICSKEQKPETMKIGRFPKLTHILYDKWSQYLFSKIISFRRYLYLCVHIIVCSNTLEISVTCKCRTARCNHLKEKCHSKTVIAWSLTLHYLHHCQIR